MRFSHLGAALAASLLTTAGCAFAPAPTPAPAVVPAVQLYADEPMPRSDLLQIQVLLDNLNYSVGKVDGVIGWRTRRSIEKFQRDAGLPATGYYSYALLDELSDTVNGRTVATTSQPARQVRKAAKTAPVTRTKAPVRTTTHAKPTSNTDIAAATAPTKESPQKPGLIDSVTDVLADAAEALTKDNGSSRPGRFCEPDCEGAGGGGGGGGWN